jgi:CO/xanthine dehydrogenase Mo-binding subunit
VTNEKGKMLELFDNRDADKYPLEQYKSIGKRGVRRTDGYEKATGSAKYTLDVKLPGMLYGRFLTSPYPHAKIVSMDTSETEKLPGVRYVLRYDDPELPEGVSLHGHAMNSVPPLSTIAYFQGEEMGAFVVADSEEIAENALKSIRLEWGQRPFVLDVEKALEPGAPLSNPEYNAEGNLSQADIYLEGTVT